MIVLAAIKTADGKVWCAPRGQRHDACFMVIAEAIGYRIDDDYPELATIDWSGAEGLPSLGPFFAAERTRWLAYMRGHVSGFVTTEREFLDRSAAFEHAVASGQRFTCHSRGCWPHLEHRAGECPKCSCTRDPARELLGSILTSEDLW